MKIKCLSPTGKERVTTQDISLAPRSLLEINTRATFLAEQGRHKIEIEFIEKGKSIYTSPPANVTIPSFIKGYLNQNIYTVEEKAHFLVDVFLPIPHTSPASVLSRALFIHLLWVRSNTPSAFSDLLQRLFATFARVFVLAIPTETGNPVHFRTVFLISLP